MEISPTGPLAAVKPTEMGYTLIPIIGTLGG